LQTIAERLPSLKCADVISLACEVDLAMASREKLIEDAIAIWKAGVDAVLPKRLFREHMTVGSDRLQLGEIEYSLKTIGRIIVVGAGKAAASMTIAFQERLSQELLHSGRVLGWVNVPEGTVPADYSFPVHLHPARPYGRNEPTPQAQAGAQEIMHLVSSCRKEDLVVCLLSGGGSALLPLPKKGISLEDKVQVTRMLSAAGATIEELNTVRIALSNIKGGGLARNCKADRLACLVISDVLGDDLHFIASGPTVAMDGGSQLALEILSRFAKHRGEIPENVWNLLVDEVAKESRKAKDVNKSMDCQVEHFILANNATAIDAAGIEAVDRGYQYLMNAARRSEGDAAELGRELMSRCFEWRADSNAPNCFISGGEPSVRLVEPSLRGLGGRNQQLALAALEQSMLMESAGDAKSFCFLSAGTDGEDGPTDAAGAWITDATSRNKGLVLDEVRRYLMSNDAYHFFEKYGGIFKTGPTGTNVCDLRVALW
jgi:hydroxypyruvate reductase